MNISFNALGLSFDANIRYQPGRPAKLYGLPEHCYPEEYPEIEIEHLEVDGKDASFLLDSNQAELIEREAIIAASECRKEYKEEAAIAAYESRFS